MENPGPRGLVTVGMSQHGSCSAGLGSRQWPGPAVSSCPGEGAAGEAAVVQLMSGPYTDVHTGWSLTVERDGGREVASLWVSL